MKPTLILVGADKGGVGKTTVSRALLDFFARKNVLTRSFDTENPRGSLKRFYPATTEIIDLARISLKDRDAKEAHRLAEIDSRMDDLRRDQFTRMLRKDSDISIEGAVDVALLGRYFERFADHAVAVGRRVIYIITGEVPEGEDWPNA